MVIVRCPDLRSCVPGEIVSVQPTGEWRQTGTHGISAELERRRIDVRELNLVPLALEDRDIWDPAQEYWREEDEPMEPWAQEILAAGRRPAFEMEQVVPGANYTDPEGDPIGIAVDLTQGGERSAARRLLMHLLEQDLRCLDAHAHLGNLAFERAPDLALRHYEIGVRIGELSLDEDFDGVLLWGWLDNRPFLRCMHGYGLCLWRLTRQKEAEDVFARMLRLNPSDNTGVRFLLPHVRRGLSWRPDV